MQTEPVIAGIGETAYWKRGASPHSEFALAITAIINACEDAGLDPHQIDGFSSFADNAVSAIALQAALGIPQLRLASMVWGGGGGGAAASVDTAASAVQCGQASYVIAFRSVVQRGNRFGSAGGYVGGIAPIEPSGLGDFHAPGYAHPFGLLTPATSGALHFQRYMHDYGAGTDGLAHIAVAFRDNAGRNPRAVMRAPITLADHHNSRMIAHPYRLFDLCQETEGACAVLVTTAERARDLTAKPVRILGRVEGSGNQWAGYARKPFPTNNQRTMASELYAAAGIGPADVDVAQLYDNFSGQVLIGLEEWGFCEPGEATAFVTQGCIRWPDGGLPLNTAGGLLSEGYMQGLNLVNEGVRQIRGESTSQVPDARIALVTSGAMAAPTSALLLGSW